MGLNIKNPKTEMNIRALAAELGVSLTEAVDEAVREKLIEIRRKTDIKAKVARALEIARDSAHRFKHIKPGEDPTAFLYDDETGLPK